MAPHSSTLAWKIPWTEEPGRLQSMGWRLSDFTFTFHFHVLEKEMATHSSVFLCVCVCVFFFFFFYEKVRSCFIHNHPKQETTRISFNWEWISRLWYIHTKEYYSAI